MMINVMQASNSYNLINHNEISDLVNQFISSQDVKPSSKQLYGRTLAQYLNWLKAKGLALSEITRINILNYKQELLDKNMSSLTVGSYISVVRKLYEWLESQKYYPNVARNIKSPRRKQGFRKLPLTPEQVTLLLNHFKTKGHEGLRDYAIVNLLVRTGLRTIELIQANIDDITFKQGRRVLMVQGKGEVEKTSFVILTDKAYEPIRDYLSTRSSKGSEPLFISASNNSFGQRLTTRSVSRIVKQALRLVNLDSKFLTAHSLRHTLAVSVLKAGGNLADVQGILRHSNPATTQIYTKAIDEELRLKNAAEQLVDNLY